MVVSSTYEIIPLALSPVFTIEPAALYYKAYTGIHEKIIYGCFAIKNKSTGEIIMVDTGLASQDSIVQYGYPFRKIKGAPHLKDVLAEKGLDPANVTTILFTHLHQDHCFNLELFPNAKLYVQKAELQHAVTPTPVEARSYQKFNLPGLPSWAAAFGRLIVIEGNKQIMNGIHAILTPGHTPGSQTIIVDTEEGPYLLVGDQYYNQIQFAERRMNGNFTDLEGWYRSHDKICDFLEANGGKILCVHDPETYNQEVYG